MNMLNKRRSKGGSKSARGALASVAAGKAPSPKVKRGRSKAEVRGERRARASLAARTAVLDDVRADIDRAVARGAQIRRQIEARIEEGLEVRPRARGARRG